MLICTNCHTVNHDPGGDPQTYRCGFCGQATLVRQPQVSYSANNNNEALAIAVAGATIGGLSAGPVGALIGGTLGALVGFRVKPK